MTECRRRMVSESRMRENRMSGLMWRREASDASLICAKRAGRPGRGRPWASRFAGEDTGPPADPTERPIRRGKFTRIPAQFAGIPTLSPSLILN